MNINEKKATGIALTQLEQTYLVLLKTLAATVAVAVFQAASQFITTHGTTFDWASLGYTVLIAALVAAIVAGLTYFEAQPSSPQNALIVEMLQAILTFLRQMPPVSNPQALEVHVHLDGKEVTTTVDQATTQVIPAVTDLSK